MTDDTVRPPIPATCEHRPTVAGVVIPWGNVQLADGGADFRTQHESRIQRCWLEGLCQLCGQGVDGLMVLFGGPNQISALQFDEPPMHPECAVYASQACPMVAGRQSHYATRDVIANGSRGKTCSEPGCDCGGWVPAQPDLARPEGGDPAHDWFAVYTYNLALAVSPDRPDRIHSCVVEPDDVVAIRHISTPGVGRTWRRVSLSDAVAG